MTIAGDASPERLDALLPAKARGAFVGGDVLEIDERAAGAKHAANLREHRIRIGHGAQDERRHDGVERRVVERKLRRARLFDLDTAAPALAYACFETREHVAIVVDEDDPLHRLRVARKVRAGARSDLEDGSREPCKQLA